MVERSRWAEWIGREVAVSDAIDPVRAEALQATLGTHAGPYRRGQPLPPLWHWAYFWEIASRDRLGPDGHARRGDFLPPIELPRRMWAGSRLRFVGDLVPGKEARRISAVDSVTEKQGRSGPLVFVTVHHRILVGDTLAVEEEQDLVYRGQPRNTGGAGRPSDPVPGDPAWRSEVEPDPVLLFRYSALTFNGHRIHYDRGFAVDREGYPGLVVHGPLLATLMLELARRNQPDRRIVAFAFRAAAPIFDTASFLVAGRPGDEPEVAELWVETPEGGLGMRGWATFA